VSQVRIGDTVALRADFEKGAFPGEYIVAFPSIEGPVSGFVKEPSAVLKEGDNVFLVGTVTEINGPTLTLFVRGSFFTNAGYIKLDGEQFERALVKVFA